MNQTRMARLKSQKRVYVRVAADRPREWALFVSRVKVRGWFFFFVRFSSRRECFILVAGTLFSLLAYFFYFFRVGGRKGT